MPTRSARTTRMTDKECKDDDIYITFVLILSADMGRQATVGCFYFKNLYPA